MKALFRKPMFVLLICCIAALFLGVWGFQRQPKDIQVEGYLDPEQKIYYVGGQIPDSPGFFFVEPAWHLSPATREEIDHYVQASREKGKKLLEEGVNDFYVGVTFRRYLSPEEFEDLAPSLGLKVTEFALRATFPQIDPRERVTIWGFASEEKIINPAHLNRTIAELRFQAREKKAQNIASQRTGDPDIGWANVLEAEEFKGISIDDGDAVLNGVFTFEAITDAEGYQQLLNDPRVFHVDVTATLVYQQLKDKGITWQEFVKMPNLGDYDPFWYMETIGLREFK